MNGDKWEDTTMKLLLFCDHWAYSSHTGMFIFSVRGIQCDHLCQTALHKPENRTPYALLRARGFFLVKLQKRHLLGLSIYMMVNPLHHQGNAPTVNNPLEISVSNISCHFVFPSSRYIAELPAITNVFLMLWPGVCGQSPLGFVCDELNGLNFFSVLLLKDSIFKMLNHFVALIWAIISLLNSFGELPVYYLWSH